MPTPLTREELCQSLGELFDLFAEWDGLIEPDYPKDDEGFPVGDSTEANMARLIDEVTSRTSRLIFNLQWRGMVAAKGEEPWSGE